MIFIKNILLIPLFLLAMMHPLHFSVTNIDYNKKNKSFDISLKIFTNDLENAINKNYEKKINLKEDKNDETNTLINEYVKSNFSIIVDGKKMNKKEFVFKYVKSNENSTWIYYEYKKIKKIKTVSIKNSILMDIFNDQTNLIIFKYLDYQKGFELQNRKEKAVVNYELGIK
ncbi:MAG: hypothetical protein DRJ01_13855 [Bacteroidetes bacterium]|nr:MAG: hypothetical protein DRJ01_13855 [Bacteroidota bacterium]